MEITIVFVTLAIAVALFVTEALPIDVVGILMLLGLSLSRVLTPGEALSGFSDPAVVTIAGFFVISAALVGTGVVEALGRRLSHVSTGRTGLMVSVMLTAAAIAAFMSNVVTTAVLMPAVIGVARRNRLPPSQFLMPLAFGAVLGGKCTLVGSATNLAISGLLVRYNLRPFSLFEFTPLGVPTLIAGVLFMVLLGRRLLPAGTVDDEEEAGPVRHFVTEVVIRPASPLVGKTLIQTDFRRDFDLQVLAIVRSGIQQLPERDTPLSEGDVLLVKGHIDRILAIKEAQGVDIKGDQTSYDPAAARETSIVEAILAPRSRLAGRTLKEIRFASRFEADVLAIYRHHRELHEKLSDVRLDFGDVLVIQGNPRRIRSLREDPDFLTLEDIERTPFRRKKAAAAVFIFVAVAGVAGLGLAPISLVALAGAAAMLVLRCIGIEEAYARVDWSAIVLIAATLPMGLAMEKTGAARLLADTLTHAIGFGGPLVVLAGLFVFTVLLTQPMANAAAGLLVAPIAINAASQMHVDPRPFAVTIAIAASCSFPTPLEPQCAIVYGPGKYRFADFVRVGTPLTVLVMAMTLLLVPLLWPF